MHRFKRAWLSATILLAAVSAARSQGFAVNAQFSAQAAGNGTYNYTITLNNEAASLSPVAVFWLAWVPDGYGYDLLPSMPTITQTPDSWYGYVTGPNNYYYADGYSIEFYAYGDPLQPGNSLTFGFNSPDAPDVLTQNSPFLAIPAGTSYVYSDVYMYDPGAQISLQPVPEPSVVSLSSVVASSLLFAAHRRRRGVV